MELQERMSQCFLCLMEDIEAWNASLIIVSKYMELNWTKSEDSENVRLILCFFLTKLTKLKKTYKNIFFNEYHETVWFSLISE